MSSRLIEPADLFELHFLNGADLSPDGGRIAYCVNKIDAEADKQFSTIYVLRRDSGETRQFTSGRAVDTNPRWSPDGKTIAFLSDRGGQQQLYIVPADGGEARQVTCFARGIGGSVAWSPDGSAIAFSAVADEEAPDLSSEPYRVDRAVYRFDAIGYLDDQVQDIYTVDVASGAIQQLTEDARHNSNPRWSPDSSRILYDANMAPDATRVMSADLMLVDLQGQRETLLTGWVGVASASFSPDGRRVVFVGRPDDGKPIGSKSDLYALDLDSGAIECRSAAFEIGIGGRLSLDMPTPNLSMQNLLVTADSQAAVAAVQAGGNIHLYRIALNGAEDCQQLTSDDCADFPLGLLWRRDSIRAHDGKCAARLASLERDGRAAAHAAQ